MLVLWLCSLFQLLLIPVFAVLTPLVFLAAKIYGAFYYRWPTIGTQRCIVITGGSSGLGAALAEAYAAPGVTIAITGRNEERLESTAKRCVAKGSTVHLGVIDVTEAEKLKKWLIHLDDNTPIDLVIANAGVTETTSKTKTSLEQATRTIFSINVDGVFNTILPIIPRMKKRRRGQIALVSSLAGIATAPASCAYSASKAALKSYGYALRGMLAKHNVAVNTICPGFVSTPMTDVNSFYQPNMVPLHLAVETIQTQLRANVGTILFPTPLYILLWWLFHVVPDHLRDSFLSFM